MLENEEPPASWHAVVSQRRLPTRCSAVPRNEQRLLMELNIGLLQKNPNTAVSTEKKTSQTHYLLRPSLDNKITEYKQAEFSVASCL